MVAAAVIGAGVIGAVGSGVAGSMAAGATKDATNASIANQQSTLAKQTALEAPYNSIGTAAIPTLEGLLGIGPNGSSNPAAMQTTLASLPGYQFTKQQGLDATKNAASASGLSLSGNTLKALDDYSTGLADSTYQQEVGNIESVVGIGQAAASGTSANIGQAGGNISSALINQGNTTAGIDANTIAGITKATSGAANNLVTQQTLADIYGSGSAGSGLVSGAGGSMNQGGYIVNLPGTGP